MPTFNLGQMLQDQGMELQGVDDSGRLVMADQDGNQKLFNVDKFAADNKIGRDAIKINDPLNPLDQSPVGLADRAKLALGNTRGQIGYLKNKFGDAAVTEDNGLVVKNKGVWQKVDQSGMDPWELTKDVVEGAVSFLPSAAASAYGAAQGATFGGPAAPFTAAAGAIAGAAAGGAAAETVRGSLGRLAGTYDATPMEQLQDIGVEALLNAGGETVALGAKLGVKQLAKGVKNFVKSAAPETVDMMTDVLVKTQGASEVGAETMLRDTDAVAANLSKLGAGKAGGREVQTLARQAQIKATSELVEKTPGALSQRFGEAVAEAAEAAPKGFSAVNANVARDVFKELEEKGYGQLVDQILEKGSPTGLLDDAGKMMTGPDKLKKVFELFSNEEMAKRGLTPLTPEVRKALDGMTDAFSSFMADGTRREGAAAVHGLMNFRRTVNQAARELVGSQDTPILKRFVGDFREAATNQIGKLFASTNDDAFVSAFKKTSDVYERFAESAHLARRIIDSENGSEVLLNKLIQGTGRNQTYKDLAGDMVALLGKDGHDLMRSIKINEATFNFARALPRQTLTSVGIGAASAAAGLGATAASGDPKYLGMAAGAGALMANPKLALKSVQYGKHFLGLLQGLNPGSRVKLLRNPQLFEAAVREVVKAPYEEDATRQELLNQAGIRR